MFTVSEIIELIFGIALFINALLFVPQIIHIVKHKTVAGLSLITFSGFLLIQFAIVLHGVIIKDYLLLIGYLLSMMTCGSVVVLILIYKKSKKNLDADDISLQEVFDQLPEHIYWKNKSGVLILCNKNNWRDFGLKSLADFKGKTDYDLFSKEEADQIRIIDEEVIKTGQAKIIEEKLTKGDGTKVLYLSHKTPLRNKLNKIIGMVGISVDITKAKKEIEDKLNMLENIIAVMPGNVYWMNKEGFYLGCNDNEAKSVGLKSRKEIVGKRNIDIPGFIIPEVLDPINKQVMEEGKMLTLEEPAILADGTKAIFLSNKVPFYNDRGDISGMFGISIDITRAKQEIEDRLAMLENIIAVMPGHVYWMNKEGVYLGCNNNQAKSIGLKSRKEIVGKRNVDIPGFLIPEVLDPVNKQVMEAGKVLTVEEPGILHDGTKATFISSKVPLYNDRGEISGMVGISIDITKEKEALKSLEKSNQARLEFISTVSHEIRNPVTGVISLIDLLEKNLTTLKDLIEAKLSDICVSTEGASPIQELIHETFQQCDNIHQEAERSLIALRNLSDLHRMQLHGVSVCLERFTVQQLLDIAIRRSAYLNIQAVAMERTISPSVPKSVVIDVRNIIAALSIVIGNAFRFSHPQGNIKIHVQNIEQHDTKALLISVQDFGIGMHQKQIDDLTMTLFHSNIQESIYGKPSVQLSRVKMYVEASGGCLNIESTLGKGTLVKLTAIYHTSEALPEEENALIAGNDTDLTSAEDSTQNKMPPRTVYRPICNVLLIEDDITTQKITYQKLLELGYQVDIANHGAQAVHMLSNKDYAIALLDITLPDINGLEVMRQIRKIKGDKTIFIAISSHSSEENEEYILTQGAMALVAKPVTEKQLKRVMDLALELTSSSL